MSTSQLDHIVVTAPTLDAGAAFVHSQLGLWPQPGGVHERMGTHNLLMRLGEKVYLEVIAPNPNAPAPERARWFAMDHLRADSPPRLATWVVRTDDVHAAIFRCTEPVGEVLPMSRGSLDWLITVPADGEWVCGGLVPTLIQWQSNTHPAARLTHQGAELVELEVRSDAAERIQAMLCAIGFAGPVRVVGTSTDAPEGMLARLRTDQGPRTIGVKSADAT